MTGSNNLLCLHRRAAKPKGCVKGFADNCPKDTAGHRFDESLHADEQDNKHQRIDRVEAGGQTLHVIGIPENKADIAHEEDRVKDRGAERADQRADKPFAVDPGERAVNNSRQNAHEDTGHNT